MDITLYYKDTRILTTIRNNNKERIVGTGAPQKVISEVYQTGESHFYNKVVVNGSSYFAYYSPLYNSDGSVVGMIFVGKPCEHVDAAIQRSIYPLVVADVIAMAVISICLFLYMRNLASSLMQLDNFLADVAVGNLNAKLPHNITERNDELGDIGRLALSMQSSLRSIIEKDTLTQLLNRRSADRKLNQIIQKYQKTQTPFCLAIGDIDFFKKVNDTYGCDSEKRCLHHSRAYALQRIRCPLGRRRIPIGIRPLRFGRSYCQPGTAFGKYPCLG